MASPRWKKVFHDLRMNRSRTLFVIASVAVGIYAVSVILGGRGILVREFDRTYEMSRPDAVTFFTGGMTEDHLDAVREIDGVDGVEGRTSVIMRYTRSERPSLKTTAWTPIEIQAVEDFDAIEVNRITRLDTASWPPKEGEVVIETSAKQVAHFKKGDILTVEGANGIRTELKVIGFVHDINVMPAQFDANITGFVSRDTLPSLGMPDIYTNLLVNSDIKDPTRADYERIAGDVRTELESDDVEIFHTLVRKPGAHFMGDVFNAVALLLLALGVLAMFLSGFLVINTISALMTQHTKQIGIMKAIGGRSRQIGALYVVMVALLGLAALAIGIPVGAWSGRGLVAYAAEVLNFLVGSYMPPAGPMLIAITVGLAIPILAALFPIRRGTSMPIVDALNPGRGISFGDSFVDRILGRIKGLPRPNMLALRNTFVRKGRLAMTLLTLSLACAMVMAVISVHVSITDTVEAFGDRWSYDVRVQIPMPVDEEIVADIVEDVHTVEAVEYWNTSTISFKRTDLSSNESARLIGLPIPSAYFHPDVVEGRWVKPGATDEIVINGDVSKDDPGLKVGSSLRLTVAGEMRTMRVVGIAASTLAGQMIYAPIEIVDDWAGLDGAVNWMFIEAEDDRPSATEMTRGRVEQALTDARIPIEKTTVVAKAVGSFGSHMGILLVFLWIMAGVLAAVGVIGLAGAMMINVIESTREIGVMRAVGASNSAIYSIYMSEGVTVAFIAWVFGSIASFPISYLLTGALSAALGFPLHHRFSLIGVFGTLLAVLVIAALASVIPAARATRVSVRDAISYE